MAISAKLVKELREKTGVGIMECKTALNECDGNMDEAVKLLRKKGLSAAAKKAGRITAEGAVGCYIHAGGKIGVMMEVNCETDFVGQTDEFKALVKDLAMHVAAAEPRFVNRDEVTEQMLQDEREIYRDQALASGKPEKVVEKIVEGKMNKFFEENCLLDQFYVKDTNMTVGQLISSLIAKIGENISVRRFVRFKLGEGLEKRQDNLAAEVEAQLQGK
jgi:elongation factor Ts